MVSCEGVLVLDIYVYDVHCRAHLKVLNFYQERIILFLSPEELIVSAVWFVIRYMSIIMSMHEVFYLNFDLIPI